MAELYNFFIRTNDLIPEYPRWIFWLATFFIIIITQVIKIPIKKYTSKISNEVLRNKINASIMILPFAIASLGSWILTFFGFSFSIGAVFVWGTVSQIIYEFISRIFAKVKKGENITNETISSTLDESIEETESAVDKFNKLVGNTNTSNEKKK